MTASDHLGPQFYHGTYLHSGIPAGEDVMPGIRGYAYFTTDRDVAEAYRCRVGRVYRVQPTGPYSVDKSESSAFKSKHPLKILAEADDER